MSVQPKRTALIALVVFFLAIISRELFRQLHNPNAAAPRQNFCTGIPDSIVASPKSRIDIHEPGTASLNSEPITTAVRTENFRSCAGFQRSALFAQNGAQL